MKDERKTKAELIRELKELRAWARGEDPEGWDDRFFRTIVENTPILIIRLARDGKIIYLNRTFSGKPVREAIGTTIYDYVSEQNRKMIAGHLDDVFRTGSPVVYDIMNLDIAGATYTLSTQVRPIMENGRVDSVLMVAEDISLRKRAEEKLHRHLDDDEFLMTLSGRFINIDLDRFDEAVESGLRWITETSRADRCKLFTRAEEGDRFHCTHRWRDPECPPELGANDEVLSETVSEAMKRIGQGETIAIHRVEDLPAEAGAEKEYLVANGIRSILIVPFEHQGSVFGWISLSSCRSEIDWSDEMRLLLHAAGNIFGGALVRKKAEDEVLRCRKRYDDFVEQSLVGIGVFQGNPLRIAFANRAAADILGYSIDELLSFSTEDVGSLIHPDDRGRILGRYQRRLAGEEIPPSHEFTVFRRDGSECWLQVFSTIVSYDGESAVQMLFVDATEKKIAEIAHERSEERYRLLAESADDLIFIVGQDMTVQYFNQAHARIRGTTPERAVGRKVEDLLPADQAGERLPKLRAVFDKGVPVNAEHVIPTPSGPIYLDVRLVPIRGAEGATTAVMGVARDITERKNHEIAIQKSEERYRALADSSPDFIFVVEPEMAVSYVNPAGARTLGKGVDDVIRASLDELWPPPFASIFRAGIRRVLDKNTSLSQERLVDLPGGAIWMDSRIVPIRNAAGEPVAALGVARNVTDRKETENALRESEERFRTIIEEAGYGILVAEAESMRFTLANRAICDLLGYEKEELLTLGVPDIHPEDTHEEVFRTFRSFVDERPSIVENLPVLRKDGTVFFADISSVPFLIGGEQRSIGIFSDVTKRKEAEEKIRVYTEKLEELAQKRAEQINILERKRALDEKLVAIGHMAARIAHEINNPLGGIQNSFLLVKDAVPEDHEYYHYIDMIGREIDRIAEITSRMYKLYRPVHEDPRPFRIDHCLSELETLLRPTAEKKGVILDMSPGPERDEVNLPEGLIREILYNLVLNGIEASERGGSVKVSSRVDGEKLEITVSDEGSGISAKLHTRIFEPFFTTKENDETGGLGLGLSITKTNVETIGGSIQFKNREGEGTVFTVLFPLNAEEGEVADE